jgi:hypothetical protein
MSTEDWAVFLVTAAAIAANLFVLLYASLAKWWRSVFGRALMTGEVALAALLDLVLYVHWSHTILPRWIPLTLYALIAAGCWMRLGAVFHEQVWKRRHQ